MCKYQPDLVHSYLRNTENYRLEETLAVCSSRYRLGLHQRRFLRVHKCFWIYCIQGIWIRRRLRTSDNPRTFIRVQNSILTLRIQILRTRDQTGRLLFGIQASFGKRQIESRTKMSRIRHEYGKISLNVNLAIVGAHRVQWKTFFVATSLKAIMSSSKQLSKLFGNKVVRSVINNVLHINDP